MKQQKGTVGLVIAVVYLLFVFVATIFTIVNLRATAFAGLYLVVLTFPWSFAFGAILDYLRIQDSVPMIIKLIVHLLFAALNAGLIYLIDAPRRMKDGDKKDA